MKLKGCLTGFGLFVVLFLAISFFLPTNMNMTVSRDLTASPEQVFVQLNDVRNWMNWSPWFEMDPDVEVNYGEKILGEGASYTWKSQKRSVGMGAMRIDESIENEKVGAVLKFEEEEDGFSDFSISANEDGTSTVDWSFESDYNAIMPWDRFKMVFYRVMLRSAYNKGLMALDAYVAEHPKAHLDYQISQSGTEGIDMEEVLVDGFNAVTVIRNGTIAEMVENGSEIYASAFEEVLQKIEAEGLVISGQPLAFGNEWDEDAGTYEMEIGIPVVEGGKSFGGGSAVKASYYGPYEGSGAAHEAVATYMAIKGYMPVAAPWEVYVTDPGEEPDPAKWLTEVYYLVSGE